MGELIRFSFSQGDRSAVESDITVAIFAAECVYGRPRVRMEASYAVDDDGRSCVLDVGGDAGEAAARVFTGLTSARLGEGAFTVRRVGAR